MATTQALFETETCTRCGGSGHYSRCESYGTTCFRCAGRKITLTARGEAAQAYYTKLCSMPARDVQPGMQVRFQGRRGFEEVIFSGFKDSSQWKAGEGDWRPFWHLESAGMSYGTSPDTLVRVRQTPEEARRKQAEALAYQTTLTKAGKPRKGV